MALPTFTTVQDAVSDIFSALTSDKTVNQMRDGSQKLDEVKRILADAYRPTAYVTASGATVVVFLATSAAVGMRRTLNSAVGSLNRPIRVGDIVYKVDDSDTDDTAFANAKGSALAAGDIFEVTGVTTVAYLGDTAPDFGNTDESDFVAL